VNRRRSLDGMRASWHALLAEIRRAPITDAQKLVDQVRAELANAFPTKERR
jgi:hypothetical protein